MIPILYESTETAFASNGIGRLADCTSCTVTEERNGIFECVFSYPITGKWYSQLTIGRIVSVIHDDTKTRQPFVIYRYSAPINGIVTFNAHHISYELSNVILRPFTASSAAQALSRFPSYSTPTTRFTYWTDKTTEGSFKIAEPKAARQALGGSAGSVLDVYGGGEYQFDKFEVRLYQNRGADRGVTIRYGKNLIDIENTYDISSSYNTIAPYWSDGQGNVVMLPELVLYGPAMSVTLVDWTDHSDNIMTDQSGTAIQFGDSAVVAAPMDLSEDFDDAPTVAQLRAKAQSKFNNNQPWKPNHNIKVDFVAMWQTDEYKNVAALQRVGLCDTVTIYFPELGVNVSEKVIKTVYNVLTERYDEIELGNAATSLYEQVTASTEDLIRKLPTKGYLDAAIEHATDLISGGLGGHVVFTLNADGEPEEILIMDTDDVSTAVNVWRFNQGGLGHSHNGYQGPYSDVALTMDGKINASMITTGVINANLIQSGTINADLITSGHLSADRIQGGSISANLITSGTMSADRISGGSISANLITTGSMSAARITSGTMSANRIKAGTIQDETGNNYWNLSTGEMVLSGSISADSLVTTTEINNYTGKINVDGGMIQFLRNTTESAKITPYAYTQSSTNYGLGLNVLVNRSFLVGKEGTTSTGQTQTNPWFVITNYNPSDVHIIMNAVKYVAASGLANADAPTIRYSDDYGISLLTSGAKVHGKLEVTGYFESPASLNVSTTYKQVYMTSAGRLGVTSSSRRWKTDIVRIEGLAADSIVEKLRETGVFRFRYKDGVMDPEGYERQKMEIGLIAEDVDEHFTEAAVHNFDDPSLVDDWDMRTMVPALLLYTQQLEKRIEQLERMIAKEEL